MVEIEQKWCKNRATQSRTSKTEDKTSSSKKTFGRKEMKKNHLQVKKRGNSNRFSSKKK